MKDRSMPPALHARRILVGLLFAVLAAILVAGSATAADCEFQLGFKTLRDIVGPDIVGDCLENEQRQANGDSSQSTSNGLLVWRKADNYTAFTDGYHTWINGPNGLQRRLNSERFPWESDYADASDAAGPAPQPTPDSTLPLAPAPSAGMSSRSANLDGALVEVVASIHWPAGVERSWSWSGGAQFSLLSSDGNSEEYHAYVCAPGEAGASFAFAVTLTSYGDGVTYRSGPGMARMVGQAVTCPESGTAPVPQPTPGLTPTPTDGELPLPPVPPVALDYGIHVENYNAWSDEGVVEITWSYDWPEGVAAIETDGIAGNHTWTKGQTPNSSALVCLPSEAGLTASYFMRLRTFGDGVTYRQEWSDTNDHVGVTVTCPFPTTSLPGPPGTGPAPPPSVSPNPTPTAPPGVTPTVPPGTPTPSLTPTPGAALPLPPSASLSLSSAPSGSPTAGTVTAMLTVTLPYGVAEVRTSGDLFNTQTGRSGDFKKGQPYTVSYTAAVCSAAQGGQVLSFSVSGEARGDGVKYRDVWGPQSTTSISVTCPGGPAGTPTPSLTPTPAVTPTPALPLPPAPSLSLSSGTASDPNSGRTMKVIATVTFDDGVDEIRFSGNLFTSGSSRGNNQGTFSQSYGEEVCTPAQGGQTLSFDVSVVASGDGVKYSAGWSSASSASISVTCPTAPTPTPTPSPTPVLPLPPAASTSLSSSTSDDPSQGAITVTLSVTLQAGVAEVKTSGSLFHTQTARSGDFKKGQSYTVTYTGNVCAPTQGGQSLTIIVNAEARGDGETYRDVWGPQSSSSLTVTCPVTPTPTPAPTPTPTPQPT